MLQEMYSPVVMLSELLFFSVVNQVMLSPGNPGCHCDVITDVTTSHCQGHSYQ